MKRMIAMFVSTLIISGAVFANRPDPNVNEKVLKSFHETFPNASQVNWQEFSDNYIVNFVEGDVRTRINYDKEGNFINATRYYQEQNLPVNILCKLKKRFPDLSVFGVTEMENESTSEYYIKMQDDKSWTTVKSDAAGNLEVVEKYKKA
jgi:hypothetical protein